LNFENLQAFRAEKEYNLAELHDREIAPLSFDNHKDVFIITVAKSRTVTNWQELAQ
jgi:hypothetical protein